ncbi:MAG: OmpA family protein [Bacteroidota bacterium]
MRFQKLFVFALINLFLVSVSVAQSKEVKKLVKSARKALSEADYDQAKSLYNQLLEKDNSNPEYYFEAGLAYFNSEVEKDKSVTYFEEALKKSTGDTIAEIFYYLGKSYHYIHQFDRAIYYYNQFRRYISEGDAGEFLTGDINRLIEMSNHGKELLVNENKKITVENLGTNINTPYAEYAPVVKKDESLIIFTARKRGSTGGKFYHDSKYYEDIYVSPKDEAGAWIGSTKFDSSGVYISDKINSKYHDAAIGYNKDETKLFIYRDKDVWQSDLVDGTWQEPVRMNKNVNTKGHEPSVYITPDEKTLFITSDREGGYGGRDLYISQKLEDGTWGPVTNMGPQINTMYDDDAPFLGADGKTFYFSSKGHNSIGGYDVFKTMMDESGKFSTPENLGMPINSAGDDIYYIVNEDNTVAFYSSSRLLGNGDMDIYRIQLECRNLPNTEIRGLIVAGDKQLPVGAKIVITDKESGKEMGVYTSDRFTGKYLMILPPEKTYLLDVVAEGFEATRPHHEEFTVPKQCEYYQLFQQINIRRLKDSTSWVYAQEATFHNAMFDVKTETNKFYSIDKLPEDGMTMNVDPANNLGIGGTLMHNKILPVKNTEVFLLNNRMEIIRTTKTDKDGVFNFLHLKPGEEYHIMINEADAKINYYGNSGTPDNGVIIEGSVTKNNLTEKTSEPGKQVNIYLAKPDKKVVNVTIADDAGIFKIDNLKPDVATIDKINAEHSFPYDIDLNDADQLFSSFITTIDTNNTELNYSEYIDIIYFEKIISGLPRFKNIYFDFDKFFLRKKSMEDMDEIIAFMLANGGATLEIDGHCDWKGTNQYNVKLSERRAKSAFEYFMKKGIDPTRMKKEWFGEERPAAQNAKADGSDDPEGRQLNRRCEFRVNIPGYAELTVSF